MYITYILIKSKMKRLKVGREGGRGGGGGGGGREGGREGGRLVSNIKQMEWKYNFCIDHGSAQRLK